MQTIQIDELLDHLPTLSTDYNRLLRHIRFLSQKLQIVSQNLEKMQSAYFQALRNNKELKNQSQNPQEILTKIKELQFEGKALNTEKISCAQQLEESLQGTIGKLDLFISQTASNNSAIATEQDQVSISQSNTESQFSKQIQQGQKKKAVARFPSKYRQQQQQSQQQQQKEIVNDKAERYCYCNGFSYGPMLACDNPFCEKEWFHYECIGIQQPPRGKWYCKDCEHFRKIGVFDNKDKKNKARKNYGN